VSTSSTFQTFGILGFVRSGVSIWVKYRAALHHLVLQLCRANRNVPDQKTRASKPKHRAGQGTSEKPNSSKFDVSGVSFCRA
jgi:hypothetical protein